MSQHTSHSLTPGQVGTALLAISGILALVLVSLIGGQPDAALRGLVIGLSVSLLVLGFGATFTFFLIRRSSWPLKLVIGAALGVLTMLAAVLTLFSVLTNRIFV